MCEEELKKERAQLQILPTGFWITRQRRRRRRPKVANVDALYQHLTKSI
jgi:hypothetical protein